MTPHPNTRGNSRRIGGDESTDGACVPRNGAMVSSNTADDRDQGGRPLNTQLAATSTSAVPDVMHIISKELQTSNLSGELLTVINIIGKVIQSQFDTYLTKLDQINKVKDEKITHLESKVCALENKITVLQDTIDDVDQYERRDTVIISGPSLPDETTHENPADLIVNTIKQQLHINMTHSDINVAHRLGTKQQDKKRPIIVKLQNRAKKSELVQACVTVKPQLYINESLSPRRRSIYSTVRKIRAQHKHLFQQCYTSDGKIIVKLKSSATKYTITSESALTSFLDKHPIFKTASTM